MRIFYNQSVDAIARRLIPGIAVAALAAWGVASGGAVLEDIPELTSKAQAANLGSGSAGAAADAGSWQDGTWTGTAQGYGGDVTVSVTIANKKITAIEVVSASGETPSFFSRAKAIIPKIIEAQNPDVDVVSGATYSSNGIINAVKNALTKASGGTVIGDLQRRCGEQCGGKHVLRCVSGWHVQRRHVYRLGGGIPRQYYGQRDDFRRQDCEHQRRFRTGQR